MLVHLVEGSFKSAVGADGSNELRRTAFEDLKALQDAVAGFIELLVSDDSHNDLPQYVEHSGLVLQETE